MTSKAARELAMQAYAHMDEMTKQKHIKILLDLHLDPGHKAFMLFEAPTAEAVRDLLLHSGLGSFLDFDFHLITPIAELLPLAAKIPTVYP